jgi:RNA polymerase sigma-70 factor (ECF subfamily)
MRRAEWATLPEKERCGTSTPLSWELTLWPKRRTQPPGSAENRSPSELELFEQVVLPHLNAAYNLARWLMHNDADAQDVVQESYLRAFRFFDGYRGGDGKAWLLAVVRNTCRTWQRRQKRESGVVPFDEVVHSGDGPALDQEQNLLEGERMHALKNCIETLPLDFREVLVMRELEEMSYQQIAEALGLAPGTVMSRLSRARRRLEECAAGRAREAAR